MDKDTANTVADAITQAGIGPGGAEMVCESLNERTPDFDYLFVVATFKDPNEGVDDWAVMLTVKNEGK